MYVSCLVHIFGPSKALIVPKAAMAANRSRLYGKDGNDGKGGAGGGNISFSVDTTSVCLCQSTYNKCDKL